MTTLRRGDLWQRVVRLGCPVCFTGDDPVLRESLSAGIGVLVGVTLVVLASFACFFIVLARRAKAAAADAERDPAAAPVRPGRFEHVSGEVN
jgi:hypothetical protein